MGDAVVFIRLSAISWILGCQEFPWSSGKVAGVDLDRLADRIAHLLFPRRDNAIKIVRTRARDVEEVLRGKKLEPKIIKEAASEIIHGVEVNENIHASKEFRSHIARVYANRAIQAASKGLV